MKSEEWRKVAFIKWCKAPWAFLPDAQSRHCPRRGIEPRTISFPAMHSLFMVYHEVVSKVLGLPFIQWDRIIKEGSVALPTDDDRYDFLREPILEKISSEDRDDVFNYLRAKVNLGHLTKVLADEANAPAGTMCRTKLWRPREQGVEFWTLHRSIPTQMKKEDWRCMLRCPH